MSKYTMSKLSAGSVKYWRVVHKADFDKEENNINMMWNKQQQSSNPQEKLYIWRRDFPPPLAFPPPAQFYNPFDDEYEGTTSTEEDDEGITRVDEYKVNHSDGTKLVVKITIESSGKFAEISVIEE